MKLCVRHMHDAMSIIIDLILVFRGVYALRKQGVPASCTAADKAHSVHSPIQRGGAQQFGMGVCVSKLLSTAKMWGRFLVLLSSTLEVHPYNEDGICAHQVVPTTQHAGQ